MKKKKSLSGKKIYFKKFVDGRKVFFNFIFEFYYIFEWI